MEKISGAFLIMLFGAIWLVPPFYWGYINGDFLAIPIWSVMMALTAVGTGWRRRKRAYSFRLCTQLFSPRLALCLFIFSDVLLPCIGRMWPQQSRRFCNDTHGNGTLHFRRYRHVLVRHLKQGA